jgi:3-oxoacyl-[acyl-carrier protein] reductase
MQYLLSKKVAVITGCNRGIGKSILTKFAEQGAEIFACSRKEDKNFSDFCSELSKKFKTRIHNIFFDLNKAEEMKEALSKIKELSEKVDILVNNAGIIQTSLFQMTKIEDMRKTFEVNFFSTFLFSQYIVKLMIKNKSQSSIINISSSAAIEANQGRSAYASSKSALTTLSKVMSKELSNFNIRVNAIAPGLTNTDMMQKSTSEKYLSETINRISQKRVAEPEEIANSVLFLASDLSSYINGQIIQVDGGLHE